MSEPAPKRQKVLLVACVAFFAVGLGLLIWARIVVRNGEKTISTWSARIDAVAGETARMNALCESAISICEFEKTNQ